MQTAIFGQSLHTKGKIAVRVNKRGYNVSLNVYLILFWLTSFLSEDDQKTRGQEGQNKVTKLLQNETAVKLIHCFFSYIPMDMTLF